MKYHVSVIKYACWILLIVAMSTVSTRPVDAQILVDVPLHDFSDRNSKPLVCGTVVSFTDKAIQVQDGLNITHVLQIRGLSKGDQKFIIALRKANKKSLKQEAAAKVQLEAIESGSAKNQLKSLEIIAKSGLSATSLSQDVGRLGIESPDDQIATAALQTFASICPRDPKTPRRFLINWSDLAHTANRY